MIIINVQQGSDAWFEARTGRVTGTRFAALMAKHTTKAYNDLIADLAAEIITGEVEESYSNAIMQRGTDLEPEAREVYQQITNEDVAECGFIQPDEDNEFSEYIGVSPDRVIVEHWQGEFNEIGLVEIKCPLRKTHLNYLINGKLPAEYRHQVQGQLYVSGLNYCDFMSYYPSMKPFIIRVYPDKELHEKYTHELRLLITAVKSKIDKYNIK